MILQQIALIDETKTISVEEMTQTAVALQKQAMRDLAPVWNIQATVDYFPDALQVPAGYWPIIIMDDIPFMAEGIHKTKNGQPYSLVVRDSAWQLICSHEMCEMLVDPSGDRTIASDSLVSEQGRVNYIVEICDPCGGSRFAYSVNGIPVCDFYTPNYFDPTGSNGKQYSFTGAVTRPKEILKGGYLSWINPADDKAYQANFFGDAIKITEVRNFNQTVGSLRSRIDQCTKDNSKKIMLQNYFEANKKRLDLTQKSSSLTGELIRKEIMMYRKKTKSGNKSPQRKK